MIFTKMVGICGLCLMSCMLADTITVHNRSNKKVFVALYYKHGSRTYRIDTPVNIESLTYVMLERPAYRTEYKMIIEDDGAAKLGYDRKIFIALTADQLKEELLRVERKKLASQNIGKLQGDTFYIAELNFRLKGFNSFEWHLIHPMIEAGEHLVDSAVQVMRDNVKKLLPAVKLNPHKKISAVVRQGNQLCEDEYLYRCARKINVKHTLEKLFDMSISDDVVPTVAVVASGGGFRAMLATIGFLSGLEQLGLLDAVTYISSLSGSTWAVGSWVASGLPITSFKTELIPHLASGLLHVTFPEVSLLIDAILTKWCFDQPITSVDFYGTLVGNKLLKDFDKKRHLVYLSEQAGLLKEGKWPLPIYTAIHVRSHLTPEWCEFTPYEIGGAWLGHYVPSWAYGRRFDKGESLDYAPEQSLSNHFGVFGSAFSMTFAQMYEIIKDKISTDAIKKVLERILEDIGNQRLTVPCFYNFTFGMDSSPIQNYQHIKLVDASFDFNLPYPPVSGERPERKPDILIFLDASTTIAGVPALKKAASYAKKHHLAFPLINDPDISKKAITVLKNEDDRNCPVIIYMPWIKDIELWNNKKDEMQFDSFRCYLDYFDPKECIQSFCITPNFVYNQHQAEQVCALAEFNMKASGDTLFEIIKAYIKEK
jgi:phospholipase A2